MEIVVSTGHEPDEKPGERKPMYARCDKCDHVWPILYLPLEISTAGQVLKAAHCPNCGANSAHIYVGDVENHG